MNTRCAFTVILPRVRSIEPPPHSNALPGQDDDENTRLAIREAKEAEELDALTTKVGTGRVVVFCA